MVDGDQREDGEDGVVVSYLTSASERGGRIALLTFVVGVSQISPANYI